MEYDPSLVNSANKRRYSIDPADATTSETGVALPLEITYGDFPEFFDETALTAARASDDFIGEDGDSPNELLWDIAGSTAAQFGLNGPLHEIQSNSLYSSVSTSNVYNLFSVYKLSGEFDIQVDLSLSAAAGTGCVIYVAVDNDSRLFAGNDNNSWVFSGKLNGTWQTAKTISHTGDTGTVRLVRDSANVVSATADGNAASGTFTMAGDVYIYLSSKGSPQTFDNFTINSADAIIADPLYKKISAEQDGIQIPIEVSPNEWDYYDPINDNTVLLINSINQSDGNTTFTDLSDSGHTVTANADVQHSTTEKVNSSSSIYFDGTGDYLSLLDDSDWDLSSSTDFTIQFWMKTSHSGLMAIVSHWEYNSSTATDWPDSAFEITKTGSNYLNARFSNGYSGTSLDSTSTVNSGDWVHVAICNDGGTLRLFIDGVQEDTATAPTFNTSARPLWIGRHNDDGTYSYFNGYMQSIQVIKGEALHTAAFTPPSRLTAESRTVLYLPVDVDAASGADITISADGSQDDNSTYVGVTGSTVAQSVYDSNYVAVYHMAQDPSGGAGCILDSTSNENHGTPQGSMTSGDLVDAGAGKGLDFDGSGESIQASASSSLNNILSLSIDLFLNLDAQTGSDPAGTHFINKTSWFIATAEANTKWIYGEGYYGSVGRWSIPEQSENQDVFLSLAHANRNDTSSNPVICVNGVPQTVTEYTTPNGTRISDSSSALRIADAVNYDRWLDGTISEVRISNTVRSATWINLTAKAFLGTLWTVSEIEDAPGGSVPTTKLKYTIDSADIGSTLTDFPVALNLSEGAVGKTGFDCKPLWDELDGIADSWKKLKINFLETIIGLASLHFTMENASGSTLVDEKGNTDGTIYDMVLQVNGGPSNIPYLEGGDIDSVVRKVDMPTDQSFKSWASWIYIGSLSKYHTIFRELANARAFGRVASNFGTPNRLYFWNGSSVVTTNLTIASTGWHHVAVVEGSSPNHHWVYLNGVRSSAEYLTNMAGVWGRLGDNAAVSNYNVPHFANVQTFDLVLSDAQVTELYQKTDASELTQLYPEQQLYSEVEVWDSVNRKGIIHTKVPTISSTSDTGITVDFTNSNTDQSENSSSDNNTVLFNAPTHDTGASSGAYSRRVLVASGVQTAGSTGFVRLKFGHLGTDYTVSDVYIWKKASTGDHWDGEPGTGVKVGTFTITAENPYTDPVEFDVDGTESIIVAFVQNNSPGVYAAGQMPTNCASYWKSGATFESNVGDVSGYTSSSSFFALDDIEEVPIEDLGKIGLTGSFPASLVWDANFKAVYHMAQDPSGGAGCILDSTSNTNHGTPQGSMNSGDLVDAGIGKGLDFDGSDDHIDFGTSSTLNPGASNFTIESVASLTRQTAYGDYRDQHAIVSKGVSGNNPLYQMVVTEGLDAVRIAIEGTGDQYSYEQAAAISEQTQIHLAGVIDRDSDEITAYLNGASLGTEDTSGTSIGNIDPTQSMKVGEYEESGNYAYNVDGTISEIRISYTTRSADWIAATNLSLTDSFATVEQIFTVGGVGLRSYVVQSYDLSNAVLRAILSQDYAMLSRFVNSLIQGYGLRLAASLVQHYGNNPQIRQALYQFFSSSPAVRKALTQEYGIPFELISKSIQEYDSNSGLLNSLLQTYTITDIVLINAVSQQYDILEHNPLRNKNIQQYIIQTDARTILNSISLTIYGSSN